MGRIFELIIVTFVLASFSNARQCDDGKIRGVNLGGWLLLGQKFVCFFQALRLSPPAFDFFNFPVSV